MANEIGFSLEIPDGLLKDLESVDTRLENIASQSKATATEFNTQMANMTKGNISTLLQQLTKAKDALGELGSADKAVSGIVQLGSTSEQATDTLIKMNTIISQLADALNKLNTPKDPIQTGVPNAQGIDDISRFKAELLGLREAFKQDGNIDSYIANLSRLQQQYPNIAVQANILGTSLGKLNAISKDVKDALVLGDTPTLVKESEVSQAISLLKTLKSTADEGTDEFKKYESAIAQYTTQLKAMRKVQNEPIKAVDALAMSNEAKSIAQRTEAIKQLKIARDNLSKSEDNYDQKLKQLNTAIDKNVKLNNDATGATDRLRKAQSKVLNVTQQLTRQAALYFSVSQVQGYVQKLATVRGEFELQQKSLQAIMQNKYEADKVWGQIVDLSVRSPFRLKQLTAYTKQLAAYRVENDKIFDTTKMLADVSAGIGVDMKRLILAYGQVKAANYLRGTELRQFSEAGINILGELSAYFTELEGRAISTADVFEMVSKRMVTFEDVNKIFKSLTESGGIFYNMQEIQAETLAGKISNLNDAYDIMLNKIGVDNEDVLKGSIEAVTALLSNYQEIIYVLKQVVLGIAAYVAYQKLSNIAMKQGTYLASSQSWKDLGTWFSLLSFKVNIATASQSAWNKVSLLGMRLAKGLLLSIQGLGIAFKKALPLLLIATVLELWRQMGEADRKAAELEKSLKRVIGTEVTDMNKLIDGFEDLTTRLKLANEGSQERKDIISKLNSQYGQYLGFIANETTSAKELADAYGNVVSQLKEKARLQAFEKGIQAIEENYSQSITEGIETFENVLSKVSLRDIGTGKMLGDIKLSASELKDVYNLYEQKLLKIQGENESLVDTDEKRLYLLKLMLQQYFNIGKEQEILYGGQVGLAEASEVLFNKNNEILKLEERITTQVASTRNERNALLQIQERETKAAEARRALLAADKNNLDQLKKLYQEGVISVDPLTLTFDEDGSIAAFDIKKINQEIQRKLDLDKIDIKVGFGLISEGGVDGAQAQRKAIIEWATLTTESVNKIFEENIKLKLKFDDLPKDEQNKLQGQINNVLITPEIQEGGISNYIAGLAESYEPFLKSYTSQLSLANEGLAIDKERLNTDIERMRFIEAQGEAVGILIGNQEKLNTATIQSVNEIMAQEFAQEEINRIFTNRLGLSIDLLDQEKSRGTILSENKTQYDKIKTEMENMLRSQAQGVVIDEIKLGLLKQEVAQRERLNELLGGENLISKKSASSQKTLVERQLDVIKELNQDYEKQRKNWNDEEAHSRTMLAYREAIAQVKLGDIDVETGDVLSGLLKGASLTDEGVSELLNLDYFTKAIAKLKPDVQLAFKKVLGGFETQIDISVQESALDKIANNISTLFDQYDLSLQLGEFGFDEDMAKDLFGFDMISLDELKEKIKENKEALFGLGKDGEDDFRDAMAKITDMEVKAQKERQKKIYEILQQSFTDREKLEKKYLADIKDVELSDFDDITKEKAKKNLKAQYEVDVAQMDFEDFKLTEEYTKAFEDLDNFGTTTINHLLKEFEKFSKTPNLAPEAIKALNDKLEELRETAISRSPFEALVSGLKEFTEANKEAKTAQEQLIQAQSGETVAQKEYEVAKDEYDNSSLEQRGAALMRLKFAEENLAVAQQEVKDSSDALTDAEDKRAKAMNRAKVAVESAEKGFSDFANVIEGSINLIKDFAEGLGVALDPETEAILDGISKGIALIASSLGIVASALAVVDILGTKVMATLWPLLAVGAAVGAIFAIFNAADAKRERVIEDETRKIGQLQAAYDKLYASFEQSYSHKELERSTDAMLSNIDQQIASLEKARAAEMDKKDSDLDAIDDYNQQIYDAQQQAIELQNELTRELGGIGSDEYKGAAQEFLDAWESAFLEIGDGLSGLEESFDDMIMNAIRSAAMSRVITKYLDDMFADFDALSSGGYTEAEIAQFQKDNQGKLANMSDKLEALYKAFGITTDSAVGELSSLQQGIQSITEPQAASIEAYLNSVRFEVYRQGEVMNAMLLAMQSVGALNNAENSIIYKELVAQTTLLKSMDNRLASVIGDGATSYIKTNL